MSTVAASRPVDLNQANKPVKASRLKSLFSTLRHPRRPSTTAPTAAPRAIEAAAPPQDAVLKSRTNHKHLTVATTASPPKAATASAAAPAREESPSKRLRPASTSTESSEASSLRRYSADEADVDASIRPITPSSMRVYDNDAASSFSHSTSNLSQTNRTYKSNASYAASHASTKPTTLLSVASDGGANRIALARSSDPNGRQRFSNGSDLATSPLNAAPSPVNARSLINGSRRDSATTTASNAVLPSSSSIQFSALPPTPPHSVLRHPSATSASTACTYEPPTAHIPTHSLPSVRNNPHPSSPALDNASMLTLASSNAGGGESMYQQTRHDEDASIRALPGSRRASESSLNSRYSAAILSSTGQSHHQHHPSASGAVSVLARPASLLTVGSGRTGRSATNAPLSAGLRGPGERRSLGSESVLVDAKQDEERVAAVSAEDGRDETESELATAPNSPVDQMCVLVTASVRSCR